MTKQERKFRELAKLSPLMKALYLLWKRESSGEERREDDGQNEIVYLARNQK